MEKHHNTPASQLSNSNSYGANLHITGEAPPSENITSRLSGWVRQDNFLYIIMAALIGIIAFFVEPKLINLNGYLCFSALIASAVILARVK
jgi:hypothetical protein